MNRRNRIRKLAEEAKNLPPAPCPECGARIKHITVCKGGWYVFERCEPCSICDARPHEHERHLLDELDAPVAKLGSTGSEPVVRDLIEVLPGDPRRRITRIYATCLESPPEVLDLKDLDPGDVLQAPDGTLYRREAGG